MWIPFLTPVSCMTLGTVFSQFMPQFLHPQKGDNNRTWQRTIKRLKWHNVQKAFKNRAWHIVFKISLYHLIIKESFGMSIILSILDGWIEVRVVEKLIQEHTARVIPSVVKDLALKIAPSCFFFFLFSETQCWAFVDHGIYQKLRLPWGPFILFQLGTD